ncbi:hypothetical protein [Shimia biformata]|uniref:hypothetical protein n=1 Tax=Shimia biformata TaxID=1294299 RepID=UPI00194F91F5|nr:hypothetical protein [Shimia biformata]
MSDFFAAIFVLIAVAAFITLIWQLFMIVADMAEERGRDPTGWVLLALFWSPFGAMFLLWLFGPVNPKR